MRIVYAIYGRAQSSRLDLWKSTWLENKSYVFIPDHPHGEWQHLHHAPSGGDQKSGQRFSTDANMLWAVYEANRTLAAYDWIFASDDDTLPFETTLARHVERRDPAERALLGVSVGGTEQQFRGGSTSHLVACTSNMALCRNPAVISEGSDCCVCPVSSQGGRWLYDERNGTARYHPSQTQVFGGTGMLLSRGLVHAMSQRAWTNCARRLVCGPADYRLVTCLRNSLAFELVHVDDNAEFARHALQDSLLLRCKDRQEKRAVSLDFNVYTNTLWSTMYKDPVHGPMLLQQVARECPWSMHKLEAPCVQDVFHANPACHLLKPRRSHHKHAPCWEWIDRKERSRVRRQHSWSDWNSTDLQALLLRELGCESVSGVHQPRASGFGGNPGRGVLRTILPAGEAQARAARMSQKAGRHAEMIP